MVNYLDPDNYEYFTRVTNTSTTNALKLLMKPSAVGNVPSLVMTQSKSASGQEQLHFRSIVSEVF
jgi:hypothetical protein